MFRFFRLHRKVYRAAENVREKRWEIRVQTEQMLTTGKERATSPSTMITSFCTGFVGATLLLPGHRKQRNPSEKQGAGEIKVCSNLMVRVIGTQLFAAIYPELRRRLRGFINLRVRKTKPK